MAYIYIFIIFYPLLIVTKAGFAITRWNWRWYQQLRAQRRVGTTGWVANARTRKIANRKTERTKEKKPVKPKVKETVHRRAERQEESDSQPLLTLSNSRSQTNERKTCTLEKLRNGCLEHGHLFSGIQTPYTHIRVRACLCRSRMKWKQNVKENLFLILGNAAP